MFDIEAQSNIAGLFPTRYQAEDARLGLIAERRRADKEKPEAEGTAWQRMPWQWKLALARILLAVGVAFCGLVYAAYRFIAGDHGPAFGWAMCTVLVSRVLAGPLYNIGRELHN